MLFPFLSLACVHCLYCMMGWLAHKISLAQMKDASTCTMCWGGGGVGEWVDFLFLRCGPSCHNRPYSKGIPDPQKCISEGMQEEEEAKKALF